MELASLPVTLVIKAPNQKIQDHTVECGLGWTVKKLKEHLSQVYPSKPKHDQQKIIYSGQLLQDHAMLKDILRMEYSDIHTVHLVCSQKNFGLQPMSSDSSSSNESTPQVTPPDTPSSSSTLRHRQTNSLPTSPNTSLPTSSMPQTTPNQFSNIYGANMYNPYASMIPSPMYSPQQMPVNQQTYSPQQTMWMQQMYAQQQMMQYYQLMHGHGGYPPFGAQPQFTENMETTPIEQGVAREERNQPHPDADNQNVRMNAQGGMDMDDDDEEMNRDWLDWIYTLCRFSVLLSILYFYSTFHRFMLVFVLAVLIFLYQKGWVNNILNWRQAVQAPQNENQQEPRQAEGANRQAEGANRQAEGANRQAEGANRQAEDANRQAEGANRQAEGANRQPENENQPEAAQEEQEDSPDSRADSDNPQTPPPHPGPGPGPGPLDIAWTFFKTFLLSLVPANPRAINAN